MGYVSEKLGVGFFSWEPRLGAWRSAVISGSSLLQVLTPAQQWSTYTQVSLEIAFFSTHASSVDFPSKSVGSGASPKAGSMYPHNTRYIHTFQTHGPMPHPRSPRAWDQAYISYVCVVYTSKISKISLSHWIQHFCTARQFCSVSSGNLIKHIF